MKMTSLSQSAASDLEEAMRDAKMARGAAEDAVMDLDEKIHEATRLITGVKVKANGENVIPISCMEEWHRPDDEGMCRYCEANLRLNPLRIQDQIEELQRVRV